MGDQHCMDDDPLTTSRRVRQDRRDEQEYLEKHNPRRFTLMEIALLLLVALLALDAVRSGLVLRPDASPPLPATAATAASVDDADRPDDWRSYGYDVDLRR